SLVPLIFFLGFPFTVFARRFGLFWIPAFVLAIAAAGRFSFTRDTGLVWWTILFFIYSAALGARMFRDGRRIELLQSQMTRYLNDAKEMMSRIREDSFTKSYERIRSDETARAFTLEEDDFLQRLLKWGCRVFNARTGILLVPDEQEIGYFRMRAAVHRGVRILEGLVPGDKGFIHITREREGTLCVSDASTARKSLSFYPEDTKVGSFLVKIVTDPKWGKDADSQSENGKIRCVLYFDSDKTDTMSLDDITARRLEEFGHLVTKAMLDAGQLQKLATEVSKRGVISNYARSLTRPLEPKEITQLALDAVTDAVPKSDGAVIMLSDGSSLSVEAASGDLAGMLRGDKDDYRILKEEPSQMGLFLRRIAELESDRGIGNAQGAEIVIDHRQAKKSPFFIKGEKLGEIVSFAAIPSFMDGCERPLKAAIAVYSSKARMFGSDELEELRTIAGIMAPALDNAEQHEKVANLSRTDSLTGLLNRRHFKIVFDGKLNNLKRGYFNKLAVIMIDADRFKDVNDTYGHPVGDEVLIEIARRLKNGIRKNDAVARYGGEEFVVVLDNAGEREAKEIAEKMRQLIRSKPYKTTAGSIPMTASFGYIVLSTGEDTAAEELLDRADQALYTAKETGRDRVVSYLAAGRAKSGNVLVGADADVSAQEVKRW
ncbi:MAG: GGDEF domain-containing protein, partial [Pseudomonadota bacterium]